MGLLASYFTLTNWVDGLSEIDFDAAPTATGTVDQIYSRGREAFWEGGPQDMFAARYNGYVNIQKAGTYTFYLTSDDGSALYIDGKPVIDNDGLHAAVEQSVTLELGAGAHEIELLYYEWGGGQVLELEWEGPDTDGKREILNGSALTQNPITSDDNTGSGDDNTGSGDDNTGSGDDNTGSGDDNTGSGDDKSLIGKPGLQASYYIITDWVNGLSDIDFSATPETTEIVEIVKFSSGTDAFWEGGPQDMFAARYNGYINIQEAGTYTFYLTSDDGSALYIDGKPVINNDGLHARLEQTVTLELAAGAHEIELLYYEWGGGQVLELEWEGPDSNWTRDALTSDHLSYGGPSDSADSGDDNTGSGNGNTGSGNGNTGSGDDNTGSGNGNTGSGDDNTGSGNGNTGSGDDNTGSGNGNTGSGDDNTGSGNGNTGSGDDNTGSGESGGSIGLGLNGVTDWSTQQPFIDAFKTARLWVGHENGQFGGTSYQDLLDAGILDDNGWPTEIPERLDSIGTVLLTDMPVEAVSLGGRYRLSYEGEGELVVIGATNVEYSDGEIWFDYTPTGSNLIGLNILSTNEDGNHIRNISVVHEGNIEAHENGEIFNPNWVSLIENMGSLRFMDWMGTNASQQTEWSDRPTPDSFTWVSKIGGVPLEVMVELANQTGTDPWFNIPHLATSEYIEEFATYVRDNLDPRLTAYFEYSNEVWNWQFEQAQWANQQGSTLWPDQGDAWIQFQGTKVVEMAQILDQVYANEPSDRLTKVISTQTGWEGLERPLLDAPNWVADDPQNNSAPYTHVDAYAVTGYFDGALGRDKAPIVKEWINTSTARAISQADDLGLTGDVRNQYIETHKYDYATSLAIQELRTGSVTGDLKGTLDELFQTFEYHAQVAEERGLQLVMYEGGSHIVGVGEWVNDEQLKEFFNYLNYTDEMGVLYTELLEGWRDAGGTLFNAFVDVAIESKWGSWGALRHLDDDTARWDAIVEFNENNAPWWTDGNVDNVSTGDGDTNNGDNADGGDSTNNGDNADGGDSTNNGDNADGGGGDHTAPVGKPGLLASYFIITDWVDGLSEIDFDAAPTATGTVDQIYSRGREAFWEGGPQDMFAARYNGYVNIQKAGTYTFYLTSDDGSALYIDGKPVIDNDGLHAAVEQSVTLELGAGAHEIELLYYEWGGGQVLELEWEGPDSNWTRDVLTSDHLSYGGPSDSADSGDDNTGSGDDNTGSGDDNTGSGDDNTGSGDDNTGSGDDNTGSGIQEGYSLSVKQVHSGHSLTDIYTNTYWGLNAMINSVDPGSANVSRSTLPGSEMSARREHHENGGHFYDNPDAWVDIGQFELLVITERNDVYPEALYPVDGYRQERHEEFSRWVNHAWENGNGGDGAATMLYSVWPDLDVTNPSFRERLDYDGTEWEAMAEYANANLSDGAPPVYIIPGHLVMARLYDDVEAGLVPGVDSFQDFFSDSVHPNHLGGYMISLMQLATIHQVDLSDVPIRLNPNQPVDQIPSPELATYLKDMVQDVVSNYEWSGVASEQSADVLLDNDQDIDTTGELDANDDNVSTHEDQPVTIDVLDNDISQASLDLIIQGLSTPEHGTVQQSDDQLLLYQPDDGFVGTDSFQYWVTDEDGNTDQATVTILVESWGDL